MSEENINNLSTENESAVVLKAEKNNPAGKIRVNSEDKLNSTVSNEKPSDDRSKQNDAKENSSSHSSNDSNDSSRESKEVVENSSLRVSEEVAVNFDSTASKNKNNYNRRFSNKQKFHRNKIRK